MTNDGVGIAMQAGRDIDVNANGEHDQWKYSLTANDSTALAADRLDWSGKYDDGRWHHLSSGAGNITLTIDPVGGRSL